MKMLKITVHNAQIIRRNLYIIFQTFKSSICRKITHKHCTIKHDFASVFFNVFFSLPDLKSARHGSSNPFTSRDI